MTKSRYITIQEWMLELGISGNDLLAYALVWGFCQDGKSCYRGSYDYLMRWLGCSRRTVFDVLNRLTEKGLIRKDAKEVNGVRFCDLYALIPEECNFCTGDAISAPSDADSALGGDAISAPHNNSIHNATNVANRYNTTSERNNNKERKPKKFSTSDFRQGLIDAGVSGETADQWLQVRRTKRATNSEIALKDTLSEIAKSGASAEQCIRTAVARSWSGFRAEWLEREQGGSSKKEEQMDATTYMWQQIQRRRERQQQQEYNPLDDLPLPLPDEQ